MYPVDNSLLGEKKFSARTFRLIFAAKKGAIEVKEDDGRYMIYVYELYYVEGWTFRF